MNLLVATSALAILMQPLAVVSPTQIDVLANASTEKNRQYVTFAAEPQTIPAAKRGSLELHFKVKDGYHINSHQPNSELLIATELALDPAKDVHVQSLAFPAGQLFSFSFEPNEKLDVYADDFTVRVNVSAAKGPHELHGSLRYQACSHAACYPPRTLPVAVSFDAK